MNIKEFVDAVNRGEIKVYDDLKERYGTSQLTISRKFAKLGLLWNKKALVFREGFVQIPEEYAEMDADEFFKKQSSAVERKSKGTKEQTNKGTEERNHEGTNERHYVSTMTNEPTLERRNEGTNIVRKRASFDIDVNLLKELKVQAVLRDKNVYEMVEQAIRQYLSEE